MRQNNINFKSFKHHLSPIDKAQQNIAATIGLLACSGLNHTQQMPEMCHLLKKIFNLESCGFFWSDQVGSMQDAWCHSTEFLSFKTLMSCLEYQNAGHRTWPPFQENVLKGAVAGYLLPFQNERFYASRHFKETYATINTRHILDVVLHDGTRPFGAMLLMRSGEQGPFTPGERNLLLKLIPIMNMAFSTPSANITQYSERALAGFALLCPNGKYKSMSEEARRIVWTLTHTQPGSFADPNDPAIEQHLEQLVAVQREQSKPGKHSTSIDNRWGRFNLTLELEPKTGDTIVMLRRQIPLAAQLVFCLIKHDFPPMRQMVAWLLAQNQSRNEIAIALGLSVETVGSHIKLIYQTTDTSSSHGLMLKLAG